MRGSPFAVIARALLCAALSAAVAEGASPPEQKRAVPQEQAQAAREPRIVLVSPEAPQAGEPIAIELTDVPLSLEGKPSDFKVTIGGLAAEISSVKVAGASVLLTVRTPKIRQRPDDDMVIYVSVGSQLLRYDGRFKIAPPRGGVVSALEEYAGIVLGVVGLLAAGVGVLIGGWRARRREAAIRVGGSSSAEAANAAPPAAAKEAGELEPIAPPPPPEELLQALAKGECVAVVGSGMSAQTGLKSWRALLGGIVEGALEPGQAAELQRLLAAGQVDETVGALSSLLPPGELTQRVVAALREQKPRDMAVFSLLAKLPVSGVVALSFDGLAANAFAGSSPLVLPLAQAERCLDAFSRNELYVLQLNGSSDAPEKMLLSHQNVQDEIARNQAARDLLRRLYYSRTLLFVGVSLEGVQNFCTLIERSADSTRPHYALVEVHDSTWQYRAASLSTAFKLTVLPFSRQHRASAIREFLQAAGSASARAAPAAAAAPKLTRIELKDIGPFTECAVDLDPAWTVLLGDNGVGKSTILKGIAVCLAGRASERFAARLIRSGAPSGQVTLFFGERSYVTTIAHKSGGGGATVSPHAGVPIELQGVLAVAFSALRTVGSTAQKRDEPRAQRPMPADLLPLTSEEPDSRLDGIKQWIARLDHLRSTATGDKADRERYDLLFREVFRMFERVTEGIDLKPSRVDPKSGEITVTTRGVQIPFESLSQGTLSLIGWTGALLQRLYETAGAHSDPKQANAIVLVDEIDAHMHPAWQQSMTERLSELFPNAQFIVTTHSPLLVGGLEPEQVYRLEREGAQIRLERPQYALKGLGVAGMVTSGLFGLASQLDLPTARALHRKRELTGKELDGKLGETEREELGDLTRNLEGVDFAPSVRDPMYAQFVKAMRAEDEPGPPPVQLTRKEQKVKAQVAQEIVRELKQQKAEGEAGAP